MKKYVLSPQHGFVFSSDSIKGSRFIAIVFQVKDVSAV
jgi:putative IMPACT (imprinted ancient) family translation regulator